MRTKLTDLMLGCLQMMERDDPDEEEPMTLAMLLDREPTAKEQQELTKMWLADLCQVVPGPGETYDYLARPLHYGITEAGRLYLQRIRDGQSRDEYNAALERMHRDHDDLLVIKNAGPNELTLVVVLDGDDVDYEASRWVYLSGALRRPSQHDVDAVLEQVTA